MLMEQEQTSPFMLLNTFKLTLETTVVYFLKNIGVPQKEEIIRPEGNNSNLPFANLKKKCFEPSTGGQSR